MSSLGRIKSYSKHASPRILTPYLRNFDSKYLSIDIFINRNRETCLVHRLVAKFFLQNYSESRVVHHRDGNPRNNRVDNLICVTEQEHLELHRRQEKAQ